MHYKYRKVIDTRTQPYPQVIHALPPALHDRPVHTRWAVFTACACTHRKICSDRALEPVERSSLGSRFRNQGTQRGVSEEPAATSPPATQFLAPNAIEGAGKMQVS